MHGEAYIYAQLHIFTGAKDMKHIEQPANFHFANAFTATFCSHVIARSSAE